MVNKGKTTDSVHHSAVSDTGDTGGNGETLRNSAKHAFLTVIIAFSLAVIAFVMIYQQAQLRTLGEQIKAQNEVITQQTEINQRYLKCIILLPREAFADTTRRAAALDKCSEDSRIEVK